MILLKLLSLAIMKNQLDILTEESSGRGSGMSSRKNYFCLNNLNLTKKSIKEFQIELPRLRRKSTILK